MRWFEAPMELRKKYQRFLKGVCIAYPASQALAPTYALGEFKDYLEHRITFLQVREQLVDHFLALHYLVREHGWAELPEKLIPLLQWIAHRAALPLTVQQVRGSLSCKSLLSVL